MGKERLLLAFVALIGIAFATGASGEKAKGKATYMAAGDLSWKPSPARPEVKTAVVQGDIEKGSHRAFHKFPPGFSVGVHHHTSDYFGVVVAGTLVVTPQGDTEKSFPVGSYFEVTGKMKHTTKCPGAAECVVFVTAKGKWDVVMDEPSK